MVNEISKIYKLTNGGCKTEKFETLISLKDDNDNLNQIELYEAVMATSGGGSMDSRLVLKSKSPSMSAVYPTGQNHTTIEDGKWCHSSKYCSWNASQCSYWWNGKIWNIWQFWWWYVVWIIIFNSDAISEGISSIQVLAPHIFRYLTNKVLLNALSKLIAISIHELFTVIDRYQDEIFEIMRNNCSFLLVGQICHRNF